MIDHRWGFRPSPDNTHVFLCGNPETIKALVELLTAGGFSEHNRRSPGQVHTEKYW